MPTDEPQTTDSSTHKGGIPSRQALYHKMSPHALTAIEKLVELLQSPNENIRLGAINKILDKCLPDIKAVELSDPNGNPLTFNFIIGQGFDPDLSRSLPTTTAPAGSITGIASEIQSPDLAQTGSQDNYPDNRDSQAGT